MLKANGRIALVTGANKGIGLEIARQLATSGVHVLLGARDENRGAISADQLSKEGLDVSCVRIDVCDEESILKAARKIESEYGKLDILVNNAGIVVQGDTAPSAAPLNVVRKVFDTNFFGAVAVVQAMLPLLRNARAGRIINISSSLGSLTLNGDPNYPGYDVRLLGYNTSKAALNMLTVQLSSELKDTNIKVVSVCPGLTKTDLNGHMGDRLPSQGAAEPVRVALSDSNELSSLFRDENGELPW